MAEAGALLTEVVEEVARHIAPGVTTKELDRIAYEAILRRKAKPAFSSTRFQRATPATESRM